MKKILGLILAFCLVLGIAASAFAAGFFAAVVLAAGFLAVDVLAAAVFAAAAFAAAAFLAAAADRFFGALTRDVCVTPHATAIFFS